MDAASMIGWLTNLKNSGSSFGLERMQDLLEHLSNPQSSISYFHIAGTNGKGSTSVIIESIQRAHGRRTGLYISPHLIELGERIQINRQPISAEKILQWVDFIRPYYEIISKKHAPQTLTFFELMTALSWLEFRDKKVDVAIIETGLGGRLDATNVGQPMVSVITSIGLDHQEYLGNTIEAIAAEKAGIMKKGIPCVISRVPAAAEKVLREHAKEKGTPVFLVRERFQQGLPETSLIGEHQRWNAGAAQLACELATSFPIHPDKISQALLNVEWMGRWQKLPLCDGRDLIIDGAHNDEGIQAVAPLLATLEKPIVVVGALGRERATSLLKFVSQYAAEIILVEPQHERACSVDELRKLIPAGYQGIVREIELEKLFPVARACSVQGQVVVLGSLYLVGEVLAKYHGVKIGESWQDRLPPRR